MLSSLDGTCVFSAEQVKKQMDKLQENINRQSEIIEDLESRTADAKWAAEQIISQHKKMLTWAELFRDASLDEKKMIVSSLVKAVTISRDYGITIEFAIDEAQYLNGMSL